MRLTRPESRLAARGGSGLTCVMNRGLKRGTRLRSRLSPDQLTKREHAAGTVPKHKPARIIHRRRTSRQEWHFARWKLEQ